MVKLKPLRDMFNEGCLYMLPGAEHIWAFNMAITDNSTKSNETIYTTGLLIGMYKALGIIMASSIIAEDQNFNKTSTGLFLACYVGTQMASYFTGKLLNPTYIGLENTLIRK